MILPHWHDHNPWRDNLIYVPLEPLAACSMAIGRMITFHDDKPLIYEIHHMLEHWRQYGTRLDGYILTGVTLTAGIRYGPEDSDYLSPGFKLPPLAELLKKHRSQQRKSA